MGFFSDVGSILTGGGSGGSSNIFDPLDFGGGAAAESTIEAARKGAEEQGRGFDLAQENLQPFLDVSLEQIPGLEEGATQEGMLSRLFDVRQSLPEMFGGVTDARGDAAINASATAGINLTPEMVQEISQLPPDVQDALVFDIEQELNRREQELFAPGTTTGTELSRLGAASATGIGNTLTQGLFDAQQARAAGGENMAAIGGSIASFLTAPQQQRQSTAVPSNQFFQPVAEGQVFA